MPKIQLHYSDSENYVAVDESVIMDGYRCPFTGKLFTQKKYYETHLKNYRTRIHDKIAKKNHLKITQEMISLGSFEEIIAWINSHEDFFFRNCFLSRSWQEAKNIDRTKFKFELYFLDVTWSNAVSNSHSCPRGERTNWGGRDVYKNGTPIPTGFPGWSGRIGFNIEGYPSFMSDVFNGTGIHTGTGGGGEYDVKLFAADWPGLQQKATMDMLAHEHVKGFRYGESKFFRY